jgi:hypothetical protein
MLNLYNVASIAFDGNGNDINGSAAIVSKRSSLSSAAILFSRIV